MLEPMILEARAAGAAKLLLFRSGAAPWIQYDMPDVGLVDRDCAVPPEAAFRELQLDGSGKFPGGTLLLTTGEPIEYQVMTVIDPGPRPPGVGGYDLRQHAVIHIDGEILPAPAEARPIVRLRPEPV